ncbi:hypothetical protein E1263_39500, partial [Kribbella antibiotica]
MSSDSGSGRQKPRRKATRARGSHTSTPEPAPVPPPEPPRYAPRGGESPFWANAQPHTDSQAWADTQAHLEARTRTDSTPQYAPRPTAPLSTGSSERGWVTQPPAPAPTRRTRQSTPAEDLAGLGAWATTPPERPKEQPAPAARVESAPAEPTRIAPATPDSAVDDATLVTPSPSYTQPPVAAVADSRTARGTSELAGPRTTAIREAKAGPRPRQAADSTAVDPDGRPVSRAARGEGGRRRPFVAVAAVLLVIAPIAWILLQQPHNDPADASLPIRDDSYADPTTKPVDDPTTVPTVPPKTPPTTPPTGPPTGTP